MTTTVVIKTSANPARVSISEGGATSTPTLRSQHTTYREEFVPADAEMDYYIHAEGGLSVQELPEGSTDLDDGDNRRMREMYGEDRVAPLRGDD